MFDKIFDSSFRIPIGTNSVPLFRIEHQVKLFIEFQEGLGELDGVSRMNIVVNRSMMEGQVTLETLGIIKARTLLITLRIILGSSHVSFGILYRSSPRQSQEHQKHPHGRPPVL